MPLYVFECSSCHHRFEDLVRPDERPACPECGSDLMKHATISFGQQLDQSVLQGAADAAQNADLLFAMGSSLVVEPAASLPRLAASQGARLVIINRDATPQDDQADAVIHASIGETLTAINTSV